MKPPNKWEQWEKNAIAMQKRLGEIWKEKRAIPRTKLKEPYQDGWVVTLELNEEDERSKNGEAMSNAIINCVVSHWTRDGKRISLTRKDRKFSVARKYFHYKNWRGELSYKGPSLQRLKEKRWNQLHPSVQKYFTRVETDTVSKWGGATHTEVRYVCNIPDHDLDIRIKKNIITERSGINPILLQEEAWLDDQLEDYWRHSQGRRRYDITEHVRYLRKHFKAAMHKYLQNRELDLLAEHHITKHKFK